MYAATYSVHCFSIQATVIIIINVTHLLSRSIEKIHSPVIYLREDIYYTSLLITKTYGLGVNSSPRNKWPPLVNAGLIFPKKPT